MRPINCKILLIICVCLFIGGLSIGKIAININTFRLDEPERDINMVEADKETTSPTLTENQATKNTSLAEGPLYIGWVSNAQSAMNEFFVGAQLELEISCNKNAQIKWSITEGDLLGKLTSNKVWWRLPDNQGEYTVTVTVQDGIESKSLSRTVKVNPFITSGDPFADITALNGGVAPIVSYDSKAGIPSMIIGRYSPRKIYTAEDAIESLNDIKVIMNIENSREEFKLSRSQSRNNITSYVLRQIYKGIPVSGGQIGIDVDSNNDLLSLGGHYYPQVRMSGISIEPAINKSKAQAIAEDDLISEEGFISKLFYPTTYEFDSITLIVEMVNDNPELVWGMGLTINGKAWEYYVHAQTGKIIDKFCNGPF
jgi:hypothetical protein